MLLSTAGSLEDAAIPSAGQVAQEVAHVHALLTKLHMEAPLAILAAGVAPDAGTAQRWEAGQLCAVLLPLLTARVREQAFRADVEERVRRLAADLQERSSAAVRQQARTEELEREVRSLKDSLRYALGAAPHLIGWQAGGRPVRRCRAGAAAGARGGDAAALGVRPEGAAVSA